MTRLIYLIGILLLTKSAVAQSLTLQQAIEQKKVTYVITGSWNIDGEERFLDADGQYFGKCMSIKLHNLTREDLSIQINNGLMLLCDDTTTQDMIITKSVYVDLAPRTTLNFGLYAMCSEIHDGMPHSKTNYKVGKMADDQLVAITGAINEQFMHNIVGQDAVWAYTDNATREEVKRYGATDASLEMTIELLNKAGVTTSLNPPVKDTAQSSTKVKPVTGIKPEADIQDGVILPLYVFFIGAGSIIILLVVTLILLVKVRRNGRKEKQPLA